MLHPNRRQHRLPRRGRPLHPRPEVDGPSPHRRARQPRRRPRHAASPSSRRCSATEFRVGEEGIGWTYILDRPRRRRRHRGRRGAARQDDRHARDGRAVQRLRRRGLRARRRRGHRRGDEPPRRDADPDAQMPIAIVASALIGSVTLLRLATSPSASWPSSSPSSGSSTPGSAPSSTASLVVLIGGAVAYAVLHGVRPLDDRRRSSRPW